jgi:hypothetical protein
MNSFFSKIFLSILIIVIVNQQSHGQASSLVSVGSDGKLVYTADSKGNKIPDFSGVGYKNSEEAIPIVSVVKTVTAIEGDNLTNIQNAINEVAAMPLNASGLRGAILFKSGTYNVSNTITISASGILLLGEGNSATGTCFIATKPAQHTLFNFAGTSGTTVISSTAKTIVDSYVPVGTKQVTVASGHSFVVGDKVFLHRIPNDAWIQLLGMNLLSTIDPLATNWTASAYDIYYERKVTAVSGNVITLDAPNMDIIVPTYATGELVKYTSARIEKCGIENMRISSIYASETDENHGWEAVTFSNSVNCWVRNLEVYYFGYSAVHILDGAAWITVENCKMLDAKSIIDGGRRYSFNVDGQRCLVQNCYTRNGRHDYVNGSRTPGPNVFYNSTSILQKNDIGPHHRWSTGILFDNIDGDGRIDVQNRVTSGSGHGWAGAQTLFWNCNGARMVIQDPPGDHVNWAIGCVIPEITNVGDMTTEPIGIVESQGTHISAIPSLFIAQLTERLGILPKQNQSITFNTLPLKTNTDADFDPGASASSGLTVTYISSNPDVATIVSGMIHIVGIGTTTITASQEGNDNYNPAQSVNQTFRVVSVEDIHSQIFNSTEDSYIYGSALTSNYGTALNVLIKNNGNTTYHRVGFFKFDLTGVSNVISAKVRLYAESVPIPFSIAAYQISDSWQESTLTYNNAPSLGSAITSVLVNDTAYFEWNITSYVQSQLSNTDNTISLAFNDASIANAMIKFTTREGVYKPEMFVISETITKQDQTIYFPSIPARVIGDSDFYPDVSASSGLPVSFTSSNLLVATIASGNIHIVGVGSSEITALQDGNDNFNAAPSVTQILEVSKKNQVITFPELIGKTYGDDDFSPEVTSSSGLEVTINSANQDVATIINGKIHIVGAGTSTITASQVGSETYNAAQEVIRDLIVSKKDQTINFGSLPTKLVTDADFSLGATSSSGLEVSYNSSNTDAATITNGSIHIVGAGTSTITASQEGNNNYNAAANVDQLLTISKLSQTITFSPLPTKFDTDIDFSPGATTTSGLELSYNSSNTDVATIVNEYIHIVSAGTSLITASQSGDNIYNSAQDVSQLLTVSSTTDIPSSDFRTTCFKVFPNPASRSFSVSYTIAKESEISLSIFDLIGGKVSSLIVNEKQSSGFYKRTFDITNIKNGVYFIQFVSIDEKVTIKVIIN